MIKKRFSKPIQGSIGSVFWFLLKKIGKFFVRGWHLLPLPPPGFTPVKNVTG